MKTTLLVWMAGVLCTIPPVFGQTSAPETPTTGVIAPSPVKITTTAKLQAESVEIGDKSAYPSEITRSAGPFLLQLINLPHRKPPQLTWVTAKPSSEVATISGAVNLSVFARVRRQVNVVDVPPGVYLLRDASGKVFFTLTIR